MALALPQNPAAARRQCDPSKRGPGQPAHHSSGPDTVVSRGPLPPQTPILAGPAYRRHRPTCGHSGLSHDLY
jgi:hypothetical protein